MTLLAQALAQYSSMDSPGLVVSVVKGLAMVDTARVGMWLLKALLLPGNDTLGRKATFRDVSHGLLETYGTVLLMLSHR